MKLKNTCLQLRIAPVWFCLFVIGAMVLLAACGGGSTTTVSASATAPTGGTNAPVTATSGTTPTATPIPHPTSQSTPVSGTQIVMIVTNSDGSFGFTPAILTITAGTTVIWKNVSSVPHTVTSDDGTTFDSGTIPAGGTFRFKFTISGTFPYHCNYHPYMRAKIVL